MAHLSDIDGPSEPEEFIALSKKQPPNPPKYSIAARSETKKSRTLAIFINGVGVPKAAWIPVIAELYGVQGHDRVSTLCYDSFGKGSTVNPDPQDQNLVKESGHRDDVIGAVNDQ